MKAALGLLGTGQLSLTKCLVLVSHDVNPRDWKAVLLEIHDHFDPHGDFVLLSKVPLDTLDFTSYRMELGSKMIIDATKKNRPRRAKGRIKKRDLAEVGRLDSRILDSVLIENTLLIVKVRSGGREVVEKLVSNTQLEGISIVAAVSEDVDLRSQESYIWGIFTRFDCERDVVFTEQRLVGISPIYKGIMGIDATWKKGYPEPLVMDETIVKLVDQRWGAYWQ
jgi:4-hydroxy-3-polyprenylbenzoate decarboxylase